jgi:hypothetical protein
MEVPKYWLLQRMHQTNPNCAYETIRVTKTRTFGYDQKSFWTSFHNSDVPNSEGDWSKTILWELEEIMPDDDPEPLGRNQVLMATIETAASGSVFVDDRNCVKQIIDLPNIPRYLGDLSVTC